MIGDCPLRAAPQHSASKRRYETEASQAAARGVGVLKALLESKRKRLAAMRQDRGRWHESATGRRMWWPWRSVICAANVRTGIDVVLIPTRVKADSFWGFQTGASQT